MRVWGGDVDEGHEARVVSRGAACWTSKAGVWGGGHEALVHALPIPTLLAQLPPVVPVRGTRAISHRVRATCFPGGRRRRGRTRLRRWLADAVGALVARRGPWNGAVMWNPHAEGVARHRNRAAPAPPCLRHASVCHACRVCIPGPVGFSMPSRCRRIRGPKGSLGGGLLHQPWETEKNSSVSPHQCVSYGSWSVWYTSGEPT